MRKQTITVIGISIIISLCIFCAIGFYQHFGQPFINYTEDNKIQITKMYWPNIFKANNIFYTIDNENQEESVSIWSSGYAIIYEKPLNSEVVKYVFIQIENPKMILSVCPSAYKTVTVGIIELEKQGIILSRDSDAIFEADKKFNRIVRDLKIKRLLHDYLLENAN